MAIQRSVAAAQRGLGEARKGLKIQSVFATKKWKERKKGRKGRTHKGERKVKKKDHVEIAKKNFATGNVAFSTTV